MCIYTQQTPEQRVAKLQQIRTQDVNVREHAALLKLQNKEPEQIKQTQNTRYTHVGHGVLHVQLQFTADTRTKIDQATTDKGLITGETCCMYWINFCFTVTEDTIFGSIFIQEHLKLILSNETKKKICQNEAEVHP